MALAVLIFPKGLAPTAIRGSLALRPEYKILGLMNLFFSSYRKQENKAWDFGPFYIGGYFRIYMY